MKQIVKRNLENFVNIKIALSYTFCKRVLHDIKSFLFRLFFYLIYCKNYKSKKFKRQTKL